MNKQKFTLTDKHIKLLRNAYVDWDDCETGAPCIDCKRPYGNSFVESDMYEILEGKEPPENFYDDNDLRNEYLAIHKETETALQIVLATGKFEPGDYEADYCRNNWRKVK
jgi:hypothetical protein